MSERTEAPAQITIRGTDTFAYVVAVGLAIGGSFVVRASAAPPVAIVFIIGVVLFLLIGIHRRQTVLTVTNDQLMFKSWFKLRRIALNELDALSFRTTLVGRALTYSIVFWDHQGREVAEMGTEPFSRSHFCAALTMIQHDHPDIQFDRELQRFIAANSELNLIRRP